MNARDIEHLYNHYKNSISTIKKLETKLLKESYSYQKWSVTLREKSNIIRSLYVENELLREKVIGELIANPDILDENLSRLFITHIDFFISEGYSDSAMVEPVLEILIPYFKKNGPDFYLFDCYYFMGISIIEHNNYLEADDFFSKAIYMYPDISSCKEDYRKFRILCSYYHRFIASICEATPDYEKITRYAEGALDIWQSDPIGFLSSKKLKGITSILQNLCAFAVYKAISDNIEPPKMLYSLVESEYSYQLNLYGNSLDVDDRIYVVYYKYKLFTNTITLKEYKDLLFEKYNHDVMRFSDGFSYSTWNFIALFDDEVSDSDFDACNLFYMNPSHTYVYYLLTELLKYTDATQSLNILNTISKYYSNIPFYSGAAFVDTVIENNLINLFTHSNDKAVILKIIENIFVHRQVTTTIHSIMVSRLAELTTSHFVDNAPWLFVGQCGTKNVNDVIDCKDDIITFAVDAAKCHDVGKIMCSDIINLQSRKILNSEFEVIKKHPERGYKILKSIDALSKYADIALGHHKFFDGSRGYPDYFDNTQSEIKIFIDIITICDCVDTATDTLGRNYARTKNFNQVLKELVEDSGVRYSKELVDLIVDDNELIEKINNLTQNDREYTYYEVFRNFIEPEITFYEDDEKKVRLCKEADIEKVCTFSNLTLENQMNLFRECAGTSFVLTDGRGNIFGAVFAKHYDKGTLYISDIIVKKDFRKNGFGSMLIKHLETQAASKGYFMLKAKYITLNHYDKFFWRNGFSENVTKEFMVKEISRSLL
ncbi:MAG: GNAT family N-acetyltransferase [Lachnospiraceae bacterium]|nr:GNAT family N-acetyltransferase [Lachnospiraceae bacterium]